jgi:hypothetical protein
MSAFCTLRHLAAAQQFVRFPGEADIKSSSRERDYVSVAGSRFRAYAARGADD